MSDSEGTWETLSEIAEVSAAALRVMVLNDPNSGIDKAEPHVRFRVEEAAKILDECAARLEALEGFFIEVGELGSKTIESMRSAFAEQEESQA
jgi:hypothetical protein